MVDIIDLQDLDFKDMYVSIFRPEDSIYSPAVINVSADQEEKIFPVMSVPGIYLDEIDNIIQKCQDDHADEPCFAFNYGSIRLRAQRQVFMGNAHWISFRRIPVVVPSLSDIGMEPYADQMTRWGAKPGGAILIGGSTNAGKTTTAIALMRHFLERYGKVGYCIESPPEFELQGPVGAGGYCFQRGVNTPEEWEEAFQCALRWNPRYILVGEISSPQIAQKIIRHSTTQCIVIATVHAPSVWDSINAVIQLSEISELGKGSREYLAGGLLAVIHQTLRKNQPHLNILDATIPNHHDAILTAVKNNKAEDLTKLIEHF